jgi:aminopeptidase N
MKKRCLLFTVSLFLSGLAIAQRLPDVATPEAYKLTWTPDFDKNNFSGEETIQVRVLKPTSQVVLNALEIDFHDTSITSGSVTQKVKVSLEKDKEQATLAFDKQIQPGPATIQIRYTGILNDQLRGFYLGKDSDGRKYAATQFESTDARRAFPSFDEPGYKATFDITVIADKGMTVISNSKVASDTPGPGDAKHSVHFTTTPKMSSYLAAVVVGNFEYLEGSADGIPIRVYSSPGKRELGTFALDAAENIMKYYNKYFGIKYPYGKLDLVGLADFSAGAMENTGCITFREVILLVDDKHAAVELKRTVASVIAHEMAHQWFGDLVTMQWWDDIWLNEGFATWMSNKPLEAWQPEWHAELDAVSQTTGSLNTDSLANTRPIHQQAETPAQILELFDGIAYGKTASVLRMLESYLGPETFRAGVNAYLKQHAYANSTAADFWSAQAQTSKKPVDKIMPTFVEQAGEPFVSIKAQCSGGSETTRLEQQRYFYDRTMFNGSSDQLWQVPVCLKDSSSAKGSRCELLAEKQGSPTVKGCSPWVYGNAGGMGYYRSGYEPEMLRAMTKDLETALTPSERIMLLADAWASVRVGRETIGDYLAVADGLQGDRNRAVVGELVNQLDYIGEHLVNASDRDPYNLFVRKLLGPAAKEVGWQAKPGESDEQSILRTRLLHGLGYVARDLEAIAVARKITDQALRDPSSVDRELASEALPIAAWNGDAALYDQLVDRMKAARTPEEYYIYQSTLTQFSDPKLLQRALDLALTDDIRSQDKLFVISGVMQSPAGERLGWDFSKAHWDEIEKVGGGFGGGVIVQSTSSFCDAGLRDEVRDFFTAHPVPMAQRGLKQSLERINYCVDLKMQQGSQLAAWLDHQGGSAGAGSQ